MKSFERLCPECSKIIVYKSKKSLSNAIIKKSLCAECRANKQVKHDAYKCPECGKEIKFLTKTSIYRAIKKQSLCKSCASSNKLKKLWKNHEYARNITNKSVSSANNINFCNARSKEMKSKWSDNKYRSKMIELFKANSEFFLKNVNTDKAKSKRSKALSDKWDDDDYRKNVIQKLKHNANKPQNVERSRRAALKQWENQDFKDKMALVLDNTKKVSKQQELLYSILDDLGVEFFRERNSGSDDIECKIGPYSFDCVIPFKNGKTLLIEVQGEYWHSQRKNILRDRQKLSYVNNNFPDHQVKYLWDHEFLFKDRVVETIKYWLGIQSNNVVEFNFDDVLIKKAKTKECSLFLSKYHYLNNAGRGGLSIGAYIDEYLVAVCVFSPMVRQNIDANAKELSRFCIHPAYQKKNFGSWFISRALKVIKEMGVAKIISYCDTTYNHNGALYKACNFELVGEIEPDYWYVDDGGWVIHKKTLYNRAVNMRMSEREYADKHGYIKVWGGKKLKYQMALK